jgi:hypothetical protein
LWMRCDDFQTATYLEVFLDGVPPHCAVSRSQCFVIKPLSNRPQVAVPTEKELPAEWATLHSGGRDSQGVKKQGRVARDGLLRRLLTWMRPE